MILCVDSEALRTSNKVQKDIDLADILNRHCRYFDTLEDAYATERYYPLDFYTSVRSSYSNKVLEISREGSALKQYYVCQSNIPKYVHSGEDLIMYLTSLAVLHFVDYSAGFDNIMFEHSVFQCVGMYNVNPIFFNPVIYTNVIMTDEGMKLLEPYLKDGVKSVSISDMNKSGNVCSILDELVIVREES